jgi:acetolactate synthase I/III small subunit
MKKQTNTIIELTVNNHSGVLSHITGLFARRGFELEGIQCNFQKGLPTIPIYLLVKQDENFNQILKQLEKLYDIVCITVQPNQSQLSFLTPSSNKTFSGGVKRMAGSSRYLLSKRIDEA